MIAAIRTLPDCAGAALYVCEPDSGRCIRRLVAPAGCAGLRGEYLPGEEAVGTAAARRRPSRGPGRLHAVPILSERDRVAGVLALVLRRSGALSRRTARLAAALAQSISAALECERARVTARKHADLLDAVELLTRETPSNSGDTALESVARLGSAMIAGAACALYIRERHQAGLHLAAASPSQVTLPAICPDAFVPPSLKQRGGVRQLRIGRDPSADGRACTALVAPVRLDAEPGGALLLLDGGTRRFRSDEIALTEHLAQIAGIVLRNRRLRDRADERARPEMLLWEMLDPTDGADGVRMLAHARRLGHDLTRPHVVIVAGARTQAEAERLHRILLTEGRNGLVSNLGPCVVAVIPARRVTEAALDGLSVGVSRPCSDLGRYPAAYREAREALDIGTALFGSGGIISVEALESYRLVPTLMKGGLGDTPEYRLMARLSDDLLKTLEVYLDAGGNATRAAKQLFLHRNTLRQRLDRIATLIEADLTASERWLPLQLAVKAARLARLRPPAPVPVRDDAPGAAPSARAEPGEAAQFAHTSA